MNVLRGTVHSRRFAAMCHVKTKRRAWHLTLKAFVGEYWAGAYHFLVSGGET
jgi:hypothetical protein